MKRKDWTGGLFFIYLAFVIWVILLKFSTSPDVLPHLRNINLIPYGDCLMVNGNLDIRELAEATDAQSKGNAASKGKRFIQVPL